MKEMDYFCGQSVLPLNEICRKFGIINQMRMKKYGFLMAMASVLGACTPDSGIDLAVINHLPEALPLCRWPLHPPPLA